MKISQKIEKSWMIFKDNAKSLLNDDAELQILRAAARECDAQNISKRFFSCPDILLYRAGLIEKYCPNEKKDLIKTCDDILGHRFDLLGSGLIEMGEHINWHRDYNTCYDWPADIDYTAMGREAFDLLVNPISDAELKFPWDLSNMMWIPSLVAADAMIGDARYAKAYADDVQDWINKNPFPYGVNWYCAMNVAMRAVNWIIGFAAFASNLTTEIQERIMVSLFEHGMFIAANLEIEQDEFRNNHYLTNIVGLYWLGHFFRDLATGRQWLLFAKDALEREIDVQFLADGVCFENSTSYHRLSAEMLMLCAILGQDNDDAFSEKFIGQLHKAVRFTRDITPSNHLIPMFGDNDNGRMVQFYGFGDIPVRDHRHLMAVGGEFFNDDSLRTAGDEARADAIWLVGDWTEPPLKVKETFRTFQYSDSGYMGIAGDGISWLIRNAQININKHERGGHAHCDAMSFTLNIGGVDLIVDPGVYCYSSQFDARNAFRSVEYHNTIQLNDWKMHDYGRQTFEELWSMKDAAQAETLRFESEGEDIIFQGSTRGKLDDRKFRLNRKMIFSRSKRILSITDSVDMLKGEVVDADKVYSRFTFGSDIRVMRVGYRRIELCDKETGRKLACLDVLGEHAHLRIRPLWFAPNYGSRVQIEQLEVVWMPANKKGVSVELLVY